MKRREYRAAGGGIGKHISRKLMGAQLAATNPALIMKRGLENAKKLELARKRLEKRK